MGGDKRGVEGVEVVGVGTTRTATIGFYVIVMLVEGIHKGIRYLRGLKWYRMG